MKIRIALKKIGISKNKWEMYRFLVEAFKDMHSLSDYCEVEMFPEHVVKAHTHYYNSRAKALARICQYLRHDKEIAEYDSTHGGMLAYRRLK